MKILLLNKFRLLKEFSKVFNIDEDTVIAYDGIIYSNKVLPPDMIVHEKTHLEQQRRYGLRKFTKKYLNDKDFRLEMEKEAYQKQLASIEDKGLKEAVRLDCLEGLTSGLYGNVSKKQAESILPEEYKKLDVNKLI